MSDAGAPPDTVAFLREIAAELADIHRAKEYSLWRGEAKHRVDQHLAQCEPFSSYATCWVNTGDGGGALVGGRFGEWAIDRLVEKVAPEDIITLFEAEVMRNAAAYEEVSPVLGVEIAEPCQLGDGVRLVPRAADYFDPAVEPWQFSLPQLPSGTGFLVQSFSVRPAFEQRPAGAAGPAGASVTQPAAQAREAVRRRCRLACLLAAAGAVELPVSLFQPDRRALFVAGEGNLAQRPFAAQPLVAFPADGQAIKAMFDLLAKFAGDESLTRAIDRLGRSRLAVSPVDRALDLGMAAEIALMHDNGTSNTEITYKIGSRAAWLLGGDAEERAAVFDQMRQLYATRSTAVHSGVLPSKSKIDLDTADQLVTRVLQSILARGSFPDWMALTMGGER